RALFRLAPPLHFEPAARSVRIFRYRASHCDRIPASLRSGGPLLPAFLSVPVHWRQVHLLWPLVAQSTPEAPRDFALPHPTPRLLWPNPRKPWQPRLLCLRLVRRANRLALAAISLAPAPTMLPHPSHPIPKAAGLS